MKLPVPISRPLLASGLNSSLAGSQSPTQPRPALAVGANLVRTPVPGTVTAPTPTRVPVPLGPAMSALARIPPGQIIEARVVTQQGSRPLIEYAGHRFTASSPAPLSAGDALSLRREPTAQPTFALLARRTSASAAAAAAATGALRQHLPRQRPLAEVIGQLLGRGLTNSPPGSRIEGPVPSPIPLTREQRGVIAQIQQSLGTRAAITDPGRLAQLIQRSGVFLEAQLRGAAEQLLAAGERGVAQTTRPGAEVASTLLAQVSMLASTDLKAGLLRLLAMSHGQAPSPQGAEPNPGANSQPSLRNLIESALSRIQVLQVASTAGGEEEVGTTRFAVELPLLGSNAELEAITIQIEREAHADARAEGSEGKDTWSVVLHFETEALGPMEARLALSRRDTESETQESVSVRARFVAERPSSAAIVAHFLPRLAGALEKAGLEVSGLSAEHGELSDLGRPAATTGTRNLVHLVI